MVQAMARDQFNRQSLGSPTNNMVKEVGSQLSHLPLDEGRLARQSLGYPNPGYASVCAVAPELWTLFLRPF